MGKTIYIDDEDALNIDRVIVNMPNTKWCKVLYSCDLIDEYEDRLRTEKVAMLEELKKEIEEMHTDFASSEHDGEAYGVAVVQDIIQEKINVLKGYENDRKDNI